MTGAVSGGRAVRIVSPRALGGFNLLPWRQRAIHRLRRRRLFEWLAAAVAGGACALGVVLWQFAERGGIEVRRDVLEQSLAHWRAPLGEAQRLAREAEARRTGEQLARQHARAATRLFALADALASGVPPGTGLEQLAQFADETDLLASAADESAAAAWLGRLRALPGVETVSVRELKRATPAGGARAGSSSSARPQEGEPIRVAAHLVWQGASDVPHADRLGVQRSPAAKEAK